MNLFGNTAILRTPICAFVCASALLAFAGAASAEELPATPMGLEIVSDDGVSLGRVSSVERNAEGRIVALGAQGMEAPAEAPRARQPNEQRLERLPPYRSNALVAMSQERATPISRPLSSR
jgi:hypothetical protein